jgi:hypothetical protein
MKNIILFGSAIMVFLILTGSAAADNQIDTSNIFIMGYYNPGLEIDLSRAIQEFDHINEITDQYVEGKLIIWQDNSGGINPGNIHKYEYRNGVETDILFATNVTVRVMSDGWIAAWLTNDQDANDLVFWNDAKSDTVATDTTIGKAIWRIAKRVGMNYDKNLVNYYSYKYPDADMLLIGGKTTHELKNTDTFFFLIPSATTVYKMKFISTFYLTDRSGVNAYVESIEIDGNNIFYLYSTEKFRGLFEYARHCKDISYVERDTRHTVYINSASDSTVKSAIAILYKSDPSNMNYLIDTEFTVIDKSMDQSFEQTLEQTPRQTSEQTPEQTSDQTSEQTSEQTPDQTSTENDINLPGFSLFAALSVLLIIVHMKQKKK